jgi:SAM-dependent methyltransferase
MASHRFYDDLAWLWPVVSPAADYAEEVGTFRARLTRNGVADGSRVLHLGCGGGSIDYNLARNYRVTGVDMSAAMLEQARRVNPDVDYVQGDMRSVRLERTFDAVLVHDAISYMTSRDELVQVYRTAATHLRPGGVLIALPEEIRERVTHPPHIAKYDAGERTVWMAELSHDPDPRDNTFEDIYVFIIRESDGSVRAVTDRHTHGVFEIGDFLGAIDEAGFDARAEPWELTEWGEDEIPLPLITGVLRGD